MATSAVAAPALQIKGTAYPLVLPKLGDPRLHLAAVIISLQVLGQVAFDFRLSIAQILVAVGTCAVLETGIAFFRQHVILWPASALLTGNGVAFVLRVPGTEHGDWWSMNGWWIFAGTAAISLLSKYVIRWRGRHLFNPSNFGLVLCFLILGSDRVEPLDFWWGPMDTWMAVALAIIVCGGLAILGRLRLLSIAIGFWIAFAIGIGVLTLSGHAMTARWHLGPVTGSYFWWILVTSPEILVFMFFMITDPKTVPHGHNARLAYAVGIGLLAVILIAPMQTEFGAKVAVLGALALACAARPMLERVHVLQGRVPRIRYDVALAGALTFTGVVVLVGIPARTSTASAAALAHTSRLPRVTVVPGKGVSSQIDRVTALQIGRDLVEDLRRQADALRTRDTDRLNSFADRVWRRSLRTRIDAAHGKALDVPRYRVESLTVTLVPVEGQGPPAIVASATGTEQVSTYEGSPPSLLRRRAPQRFARSFEVLLARGRYVIVGTRPPPAHTAGSGA